MGTTSESAAGPEGTGDAVGEVRARRERLRQAMDELEAAIAAPLPGREPAWARAVADSLAGLADVFERHVASAEAPGGFLDQVATDAPRLQRATQQVRDDHRQLGEVVAGLRGRARATLDDGSSAAELRTAALRLLGRLAEHRQLGADLLYEAYQVDIGPGD